MSASQGKVEEFRATKNGRGTGSRELEAKPMVARACARPPISGASPYAPAKPNSAGNTRTIIPAQLAHTDP